MQNQNFSKILILPITRSNTNLTFFSEKVYLNFEIQDIFTFSGILINGKEEGLWISWYPNGQKESEGNFVNGQEGLWTTWYPNGQKKSEGDFVNGKLFYKNNYLFI